MSIRPDELYELSDKELLERMGGAQPGSLLCYAVESEFRRRALAAQVASADQTRLAAKASQEAAEAAKVTAKWTRSSVAFIAISAVIAMLNFVVPRGSPSTPELSDFAKDFQTSSVLVKTCARDPRYASGPTSNATRVYRYEGEMWYQDGNAGYRRIEGSLADVCKLLAVETSNTMQ